MKEDIIENSVPKTQNAKPEKGKEESLKLVDPESIGPLFIEATNISSEKIADVSHNESDKNEEEQYPTPSVYCFLLVVGALSIPGCLLRVTFVYVCKDWIGNPATASLLANLVGCLILGATSAWPSFKLHKAAAKAVGTGLCGSITTFSMYGYEANMLYVDYGVGIYIFCMFLTMLASSGAFLMGQIFGELLETLWNPRAYILSPLGYLIAAGVCFPISFWSYYDNSDLWISLLLSPPGAMLRFLLGKYLNKMDPRSAELSSDNAQCPQPKGRHPKYNIFLGTIVANGSGSLLYLLLKRVKATKFTVGITTGFCGCFTTVSTFISETISLGKISGSRWRALVYQFATHFLAVVVPLFFELVWKHFGRR